MSDDRIKVLSLSDSLNVPTGYARVMREIITRMDPDKFDWHHLGTQTQGMPRLESTDFSMIDKSNKEIYEEAKKQGFSTNYKKFNKWFSNSFTKVLPVGGNPDGSDIFKHHKNKIQPDICFFLKDLWMYNWVLNEDFSPAKSIFYYPADGYPMPLDNHKHIIKSDQAVAMSKFGKQCGEEYLYTDAIDGKKKRLGDVLTNPIKHIPHGVDNKTFKALKPNEVDEIKRKNGMENQFVIGFVGRNQPRKSHSVLIKAYAEFAKDKRDVSLYLHCDLNDPANQGANLSGMVRDYDVPNFRFTKMQSFKYGVTDKVLNEIYNCFSVHAPISSGEGFGIPIIESAACGVPNILTDYTTSAELLGLERENEIYPDIYNLPKDNIITKQGILVPPNCLITGSMNVERAIADPNKVIEALQYMYDNPSEVKKMGAKSKKFALTYDWDDISTEWATLFTEMAQ